MANNKSKIDQIHDLLPKHLNSKTNTNWKALVEALGEQDQKTADLVAEVRKQFFVKTASRPYLDRLAANNKIARPRLVGMDDSSFRQYIPVLSYQPKQVKLIIDQLLDIFFFKESTTAYITSSLAQPFNSNDGWELELLIDELHTDRVILKSIDFSDINNIQADEIVAAINRQTKYCYATAYYDSITKNTYIRIFTNTTGSKGSIRIVGGRANTSLRFNGFIETAGLGSNTQWSVTKIGDEVTFTNIGGANPGIDQIQEGDIVIINIAGNIGSFPITNINLINNSFKFKNLFATVGTFTNTSEDDVKFIRPIKNVAYLNPRRAITWETNPGEITVEMPTSPPVVKRSLKGSTHLNGPATQMLNRDSDTSITVENAFEFPESGSFWLENKNAIITRMLTPTENEIVTKTTNSRLQHEAQKYNYTSRVSLTTTGDFTEGNKQIINLASTIGLSIGDQVIHPAFPTYTKVTSIVGPIVNTSFPAISSGIFENIKFLGNQLTGITPNLPTLASLNEISLTSLSRTSNEVTVTTATSHNYIVGESAIISGCSGILLDNTIGNTTNGSNVITNVGDTTWVMPGVVIAGTGIQVGSIVESFTTSTITMNKPATLTQIGSSFDISENLNGGYIINSITSNTFTFIKNGQNGVANTPGSVRVERVGLSNAGSRIILSDSVSNNVSRITGPYVWDQTSFTLSSKIATINDDIQAGKIVRLLSTSSNEMSDDGGFVIFNYGKSNQEGPVRYMYKPTNSTIAIDPSYTFKYNHESGSPMIAISHKGPHQVSTNASEYSPYITDPSEARFILQDLIRSVKSAGIFVNFLIRYPEQLYSLFDVYNQQGLGAGEPFED